MSRAVVILKIVKVIGIKKNILKTSKAGNYSNITFIKNLREMAMWIYIYKGG